MFHIDEELASKFKDTNFVARFGKYLGTYVSDNEQVRNKAVRAADVPKADEYYAKLKERVIG
ncbi:hypothetical protein H8E77_03915 [bacterium]|nr:hypothetical protein [bacterium]